MDRNESNKNKERENVCLLSFKFKEKYFSIATIYNEWFGLGTFKRIVPGVIYSSDKLHPEWRNNNNSAFKKKLSRLQLIANTVVTLAFSIRDKHALVLDALKETIIV